MAALRVSVCVALAVCWPPSLEAVKVQHLTAQPEVILEGLTTDLTLRCSVGEAAPTVNSVLLIQIEKLGALGHQVSLATVHDGQSAVLDSTALASRATVTASIDHQNVSASFLQVELSAPLAGDEGQYLCVIMVLDTNNLLTQLADHVSVNTTQLASSEDLRRALVQLVERLNAGGLGKCPCGGGSPTQGEADLQNQVRILEAKSQEQSSAISQLQSEVTRMTSHPSSSASPVSTLAPAAAAATAANANHSATSAPSASSSSPTATAATSQALGFVAVGPSGSVDYNNLIYNTDGDFDLVTRRFTAPQDGFYIFHAFDSQPSRPMMSLFVNNAQVMTSAKAVATNSSLAGLKGDAFQSLSLSAMIHLRAGDVVKLHQTEDSALNYGASFSGVKVSP